MIRHDDFERSSSKDPSSSTSNGVGGTPGGLNFNHLSVGDTDWSSRQQTFASDRDAVYLPSQGLKQFHAYQQQQQQQQQYQLQQSMQAETKGEPSPLAIPFFGSESNRPGMLQPTNGQVQGKRVVNSIFNTSLENESKSAKNSPVPSSDASYTSASASFYPDSAHSTHMNSNNLSGGTSVGVGATSTAMKTMLTTNFDKKEHIPNQYQHMIMNILPSANKNENPNAIYFAFQIPSGQVRQNEKTMMRDVLFKVYMKIYSNDGPQNIKTVHSTLMWLSEIKHIHDSLGFMHNLQFPNINISHQSGEGTKAADGDTALAQQYLNSVAEMFLNQDMKSQHSISILDKFDDETHTLSDKIRVLMLESSLVQSIVRTKGLEKELSETKNELESTKRGMFEMIAMLRREVEQLQLKAGSMRQNEQISSNSFSQPSSPLISNANLYYQRTQQQPAMPKPQESMGTPGVIIEFAEIEPNTLVSIADAILLEKGPLPVGEVGKMLQEATGNLQLSQMLKEKHNGLKKFLEKYSDKFIMSNDHPFNPHVYLRRCFSPDEQRLIENGCKVFLDEFKKNKQKIRRGNPKQKSWPAPPQAGLTGFQHQKQFP